jgi:hypothetical protein
MRLFATILLLFVFAVAQNGAPRVGSSANITITTRGALQPSLIEVRTDPTLTGNEELRFWIYRNDDDLRTFESRVVAPLEPGLYQFEHSFSERGNWGLNMRYGTGLDLYYANVSGTLDPTQEKAQSFQDIFYGTLTTQTPGYIQPLGFGIFALMLVIALTLVITILRWLKRQQKAAGM